MKKYLLIGALLLFFVSTVSAAEFMPVGEPDQIWLNTTTKTIHSYDKFDYALKGNGIFTVSKFGELQATYGFGMTGTYNGSNIYKSSTDYEWNWTVLKDTNETITIEGKIKNYETEPFKWKILMVLKVDKPLKITNYVENATGQSITNLEFFYLFAVNTEQNPNVSYWNEQNEEKQYTYETNITINDETKLENISFNNIMIPNMGFDFQDIKDNNYFLTYLYFGNLNQNKNFLPDKNGFIIGFSKGNQTLLAGQSHTIDPAVWSSLGDKGNLLNKMVVYDGNLYTADSSGVLGTYNSTTKIWTNLGDKGANFRSMVVYDGNLYTGDDSGFLGTCGGPDCSTSWFSLGDKGYALYSMTVYDGNLYTGGFLGTLGTCGGPDCSTSWFDLGDKCNSINEMVVYDGNLYTADSSGVLGTYNSTTRIWTSLEDRSSGAIEMMTVYDENIYTGDNYGVLGTYNSATKIWTNLGNKGGVIYHAEVYDGNVFISQGNGYLATCGGPDCNTSWFELGDYGTYIMSMAVYDGNLYTGDSSGVLGTYGPRQTNTPPELTSIADAPDPIDGSAEITITPTGQGDTDLDSLYYYCNETGTPTSANTLCSQENTSYATPYGTMTCTYNVSNGNEERTVYCRTYDGTAYSTQRTTTYTVVTANACNCPASGHWQINNGDICTLTAQCNLSGGGLHIINGTLNIANGGTLTIPSGQKAIVNKANGKLIIEKNGGKLQVIK